MTVGKWVDTFIINRITIMSSCVSFCYLPPYANLYILIMTMTPVHCVHTTKPFDLWLGRSRPVWTIHHIYQLTFEKCTAQNSWHGTTWIDFTHACETHDHWIERCLHPSNRNISGMPGITGTFPQSLSSCTALTGLFLHHLPGLTGTIPADIFHPKLQRLWVLDRSIPSCQTLIWTQNHVGPQMSMLSCCVHLRVSYTRLRSLSDLREFSVCILCWSLVCCASFLFFSSQTHAAWIIFQIVCELQRSPSQVCFNPQPLAV